MVLYLSGMMLCIHYSNVEADLLSLKAHLNWLSQLCFGLKILMYFSNSYQVMGAN